MKKRIPYFILTLIFGLCRPISAQSKIVLHIDNKGDNTFYLTHYYGTKFMVDDTAQWHDGKIVFEQETKRDEGLYVIGNSKKERLFEFLLGEDQKIEVTIPKLMDIGDYSITGDSETAAFLRQTQAAMAARNAILALSEETGMKAERQIDSINVGLMAYRESLIETYKGRFLSSFLKAMKEPEIPDSIIINRQEAYRYYKAHYWDFYDFADERLLRTPLLDNKLDAYFNRIISPHPDSILCEIDKLLAKAKDCPATRDYLLWHFLKQYEYPEYMAQDVVFVSLYDKYFSKLNIKNLTQENKAIIEKKAERMRKLLLHSTAPALDLKDTEGRNVSLHSVKNEYTLLFFYDHECETCSQEMQSIDSIISHSNYDIAIYAVDMNPDMMAWKENIMQKPNNHLNVNGLYGNTKDVAELYNIDTTPLLYVLDRNKSIIAKSIQAKRLPAILIANRND